ncbi:MAG: indole-3-glycerol phosphate synthase TrpC [Oscillospiraceae bacterium]|jgi:indole-3-glycerol phosphate synthase|nr:indole-3-glycerol phosphate synthase TrpC [Oscillospiraceae bacterium]
MSTILDKIAADARARVARAKEADPPGALAARAQASPAPPKGFPFERALAAPGLSFICEVKRASPSKGVIDEVFPYREIAREYERAGAAALSVLTEPTRFGGRDHHLREIAADVACPVLRKDFVVDDYQICEARLLGASAVLLIAALLDEALLRAYLACAHGLGLSALVEARTEAEVDGAVRAGARVVGVNNRDLKTFEVDFATAARLRGRVPTGVLFVAESGVRTAEDVRALADVGADAVLVGETLMRAPDKGARLAELRALL